MSAKLRMTASASSGMYRFRQTEKASGGVAILARLLSSLCGLGQPRPIASQAWSSHPAATPLERLR